jgi:hypothetical protein
MFWRISHQDFPKVFLPKNTNKKVKAKHFRRGCITKAASLFVSTKGKTTRGKFYNKKTYKIIEFRISTVAIPIVLNLDY